MTVSLDRKSQEFVSKVLDDSMDMTIATKRQDGFPQATVVSFVHNRERIYFGCDASSQKAQNITHDERVSVTVTAPYADWKQIRGVSMGARARKVTDEEERLKVGALMMKRFPQAAEFTKDVDPENLVLFRIDPEAISILDYRQGFGHTELKTALTV